MRLLDVHQLTLTDFPNEKTRPSYAILSHKWGDGEVSLQDIQTPALASSLAGYAKIKKCCEVAIENGFQYVWIDTCCIDKKSSAELSEAINSMYDWYQSAAVCYAYLSDVLSGESPSDLNSSFYKSRWFTRGWTLQELLAPKIVMFYDCNWVYIGTKRSLLEVTCRITGIAPDALLNEAKMETFSIAQRMSWAAKRETERVEDIAYCLMGIFNLNMPTLYGEGKNAFIRLQYEIMKGSDDHSLFAWAFEPRQRVNIFQGRGICYGESSYHVLKAYLLDRKPPHDYGGASGLLSSSPRYFEHSQGVLRMKGHNFNLHPFSITNNGLHIWLPMVRVRIPNLNSEVYQVILNCKVFDVDAGLSIFLERSQSGQYSRIVSTVICAKKDLEYGPKPVELYVKEDYLEDSDQETVDKGLNYQLRLVENASPNKGYILLGASSPQILEDKMVNLVTGSPYSQTAYIIIAAKKHPSIRYLVFLIVDTSEKSKIFCSILAGELEIEQTITATHECKHNPHFDRTLFDAAFSGFNNIHLGEQIIQKLPNGKSIFIHFRKGPESGDGVYMYQMAMKFITPA